ncbi:MAG TPA: 3,4-dihydroxy-2-butanone-4-phosphate synthase, partial [Acidimicrobiales bacterium]|nr:3,4-dihydroxy-2-butanone-4-phosphate synthase [Acidimicrobiales bacterium]
MEVAIVFTGCIREIGAVVDAGAGHLQVDAPKSAAGLEVGGSVAVSGVCLTAVEVTAEGFRAELSDESRRRSVAGEWRPGDLLNLELPLRAGDPLDGHLVQGHVDAVGKIAGLGDGGKIAGIGDGGNVAGMRGETPGHRVWIRPPRRFLSELTPKGSVAVDGVSLTVAEIVRDRFAVALVPATLEATTLAHLEDGHRVNLEADVVSLVARQWASAPAAALAAVVGSLPWAGRLAGRVGVDKAVAQIAAGGGVVVWDPHREGEGDVVFAGARLRPQAVTFLLTQACGHTTVPCAPEVLDRLEIPPLPGAGDRQGTAPHVPVDLAEGRGTGVSAAERAATVRRLAHPDARPGDFLRPGHVFPLRARPGGLAERAGHTEAGVALCRAAGLAPVAAVCEVMNPDGRMAGEADLERFALRWGLPMVGVDDLDV